MRDPSEIRLSDQAAATTATDRRSASWRRSTTCPVVRNLEALNLVIDLYDLLGEHRTPVEVPPNVRRELLDRAVAPRRILAHRHQHDVVEVAGQSALELGGTAVPGPAHRLRRHRGRAAAWPREIFAMARVSPTHALIVANLCRELSRSLSDRPCFVFSTDLRLHVETTGLHCHPDVMVVCETPRYVDEERDTLLNPSLVVEVLSPSTEDWDRGGKFAHYRTIDSVTDYLLVRQDSCHVELFHRAPEGHWIFTEVQGMDRAVDLASISVGLELGEVYHKVEELGWSK